MGTMHHHAMIVTCDDEETLRRAHHVASGLSPHVSNVVAAGMNGYYSFAVLPDGSKEYWADSDVGDDARAAIRRWIDAQAYEYGSNSLEYALVSFGELEPTIETNRAP